MLNIICAVIAATATIICAFIASASSKAEQERKTTAGKEEEQVKQRIKESRLQLAMIAANSELTVGVAMALKNGHCNGEVEAGLAAVERANKEYVEFLEKVALNNIKGEV